MKVRLYNKLVEEGENKVQIVKIVKDFTGLGLKDTKELIDPVFNYENRRDILNKYEQLEYVEFEIMEEMVAKDDWHYTFIKDVIYTPMDFARIMRERGWKVWTQIEFRQQQLKELGL